jgi:tetratricopeptide (TPR) repeat protein
MSFNYSNTSKENFLKVTNPNKKDEKFFCAMGDSFMLQNEYRKAIKEYLVSLMIDKKNIHAIKGASKAYKNLQEYEKAIKHLKQARNIYGFDSEIYYELGLNYLLNGNNEHAQKNFRRTIKLRPDDKNAQVKLALTHELSGEEDMAIMVYSTIIEKNPNYIPAIYSLANLYIEKEMYKEAIVKFKEILKINQDYHRAYLGLGLCFDKLNKYVYATRYYKKYIALKPNSQTAKSLVGRIYEIYKKSKNTPSKNKRELKIIS